MPDELREHIDTILSHLAKALALCLTVPTATTLAAWICWPLLPVPWEPLTPALLRGAFTFAIWLATAHAVTAWITRDVSGLRDAMKEQGDA